MLFAGLRNPTANAVGGRQAPTSSLTSLLFAMGEQGLHECGIELLVWEGVIIEIVTDLVDRKRYAMMDGEFAIGP